MNKKLLILSLTLFSTLTSCGVTTSSIDPVRLQESATTVLPSSYAGANFKTNFISYELNNAIATSINTFEASIRMETNETRTSSLFCSYNYHNSLVKYHNDFINYEINGNGNVVVKWASSSAVQAENTVTITFTSTNVRTGNWVHIAVTRNSSTSFSLYIDGQLVETVTCAETKNITTNEYKHRIGGTANTSGTANFYGEIGSITCYSDVKTAEDILTDFQNISSITGATRTNLMFHTNLKLGLDVALDTSNNLNHAHMITKGYYYDAPKYEITDDSYSFGIVGDTQELSRFHPEGIKAYSDWAIANKDATNLEAMLFMGDLTDGTGSSTNEENAMMWENYSKNVRYMDNKVPYTFIPGNHDYLKDSNYRDLTMMNYYMPYNYYSKFSYFGGAYKEGQIQNTYYLFNIKGIKYIIFALDFGPEAAVMEWVSDTLTTYSDYRAIITTHAFLDVSGEIMDSTDYLSPQWYFSRKSYASTNPDVMWDSYLKKHDNVFMILCGHTSTEDIAYKTLVGEQGNTTMIFRIDPSYIFAGNSGNGFAPLLALFNINEATTTLTINYFSCENNMLFNVQNQMRINFTDYTRYTHSYYNFGKEILA